MRLLCLVCCGWLLASGTRAQVPYIQLLHHEPGLSLRTLQLCPDGAAWTSGTQGRIGLSQDQGRHWRWFRPTGADSLDFRSLWAFDARRAVVASAGTPAAIYLTRDGGRHWKQVFFSRDPRLFLDGLSFWNSREGVLLGDPVDGRFLILATRDGGRHWNRIPAKRLPKASPGEAFFAASNGFLKTLPPGRIWAVSGGRYSRLMEGSLQKTHWTFQRLPLQQGQPSQGAFAMDVSGSGRWVVVGGDFQRPWESSRTAAAAASLSEAPQASVRMPAGYRSSVRFVTDPVVLCCGPSGVDESTDGGLHWQHVSREGFNVLSVAPDGTYALAAGSDGRIACIRLALRGKL